MVRMRVKKAPVTIAVGLVLGVVGLYAAKREGYIGSAPPAASASPEVFSDSGVAGPVPPPSSSGASVRFCGSNTVGADLAPALAEEFLASKGASDVRRESGGDVALVSGRISGDPGRFSVEVRSSGTSTAFRDVLSGRCDVGMASREATVEERSRLGPELVENVIGLDGIAVVVHQGSPVSSLTVAQISSLFTGSVRDWAAVGGPPGPVDVVSYDDKSGTHDTFRKLALGDAPFSPSARLFSSSSELVRAVQPSSVSYTSLSSARGVKILAVGDAGTDSLAPTVWTVARESYAFTRRLYLYTHSKLTRPAADSLVLFALSGAGQNVVSRTGFVDLSVKAEPPDVCRGCPPQYVQATYGFQRLSVDFRFQNGSSSLDSRGLADADRVAKFVRPGASVQLVGFADNSGAPAANQGLSRERAERVKADLQRRGVGGPITTFGMGSLMPAASNASDSGRQRNRRVEVWVSR